MTDRSFGRRELLIGGAVAGASSAAGLGGYLAARELDRSDGQAAQAAAGGPFPLDPGYVNLTTFLLAPHPRRVQETIERHRAALDANAAMYLHESEAALDEDVWASAAGYLGAEADEIAVTESTTMGLALVYRGLRLEAGDEVVTTEHDFYATHESLRQRQEVDGITVRRIRLYEEPDSASVDEIASAVERVLGARTRALAITWVHSSSGVKLPLREIAEAVAAANEGRSDSERILLCVDGVHGFGVEDASPVELGVDVFVSGCHKWLFGPRGTGLVWAAPHAWERLRPTIPTFDGRAYLAWIEGRAPTDTPPGPLMTPGGFHAFEHRWALPEAFSFHDELGGRARVAATTRALAARLKSGLAAMRDVRVKTPTDEALSAGLVCAEIGDLPAPEVVDRLREEHRVVASVTPYATQYVRFGPSVANSEEDVDAALEAVAAIAG